jgi:hypothetical protein
MGIDNFKNDSSYMAGYKEGFEHGWKAAQESISRVIRTHNETPIDLLKKASCPNCGKTDFVASPCNSVACPFTVTINC